MAPSELLAELSRRGVELFPEGEGLRYRAPAGALTPELRQAVASRKRELLKLLSAEREAEASVRIYSRHLDAELWIAPDQAAASDLECDFAAEGDRRIVFTVADAIAFGRMLEADARAIFAAMTAAREVLGGSGPSPIISVAGR